MAMKQRAARHTAQDLRKQVAELRQLVTVLKEENARSWLRDGWSEPSMEA